MSDGRSRPRLKMLQPSVRVLDGAGSRTSITVPTRGNSNQRGYTYRWQQYRITWLREHPLCGDRLNGKSAAHSECARSRRASAATDVDHIKRVSGPDDPLFWDPSNHQSLCHECHSSKTAREDGGFGNIVHS